MLTQYDHSKIFDQKKKALERKEEILKSAIDLFGQKGFSRTPTAMIARKAGVAEGLIFHYFKNKKGILVHILLDILDAYLSGLEGIWNKNPTGWMFIEQFVRFHFTLRESRAQAFLVMNRELVSDIIAPDSAGFGCIMEKWDGVLAAVEQGIEKGQADGTIRKDIPVVETALVIRGLLMGMNSLYREILQVRNLEAMPGEVVNFIFHSLSPHSTL